MFPNPHVLMSEVWRYELWHHGSWLGLVLFFGFILWLRPKGGDAALRESMLFDALQKIRSMRDR